ncbi:MAG TPA: DUF397 domain-containing protein [Actinophytocola sp.]|jgi:hypothetical protein|nr:DUF397 domain-containing protein [Actinophytocola sp.]
MSEPVRGTSTADRVWARSSRCTPNNDCVEVAAGTSVGVRDSKNTAGPALEFAAGSWAEFLVRCGR